MKTYPLFITLLLFVAACAGPGAAPPDRAVPFIGGNVGLEIGLINGLPPASVFDNKRMAFGVGAALHNVGEADIGFGTDNEFVMVGLEGFSPSRYGITPADMQRQVFTDRPLVSAKKNFDGSILPGQIHNEVFQDLMYQDRLQGNHIENIVVTACYDYENWATALLCFKNEILQTTDDICSLTGEKLPQNSGGPIHVSSLVQNPLAENKVLISFVLEHVGTGEFYGRSPDEDCNPAVTNLNKFVTEVEVGSENPDIYVECNALRDASAPGQKHTGWITLYAGAPTTITCSVESAASTRIFTEPITINTKYRYGERIRQPIIIQAVGDR